MQGLHYDGEALQYLSRPAPAGLEGLRRLTRIQPEEAIRLDLYIEGEGVLSTPDVYMYTVLRILIEMARSLGFNWGC